MQFSGFQIIGFLFLFAGVGLSTVGLATTNWGIQKVGDITATRRGLWQMCLGEGSKDAGEQLEKVLGNLQGEAESGTCINKFANIFKSGEDAKKALNRLDTFEISVFSLMLIAAVVGFLALVTSPCCCNRCGGCLTFLVGTALLSGIAAIAVYAYYAKSYDGHKWDFGWSYWVSLGGVAGFLLADIFFGVATARHGYGEYSHAI